MIVENMSPSYLVQLALKSVVHSLFHPWYAFEKNARLSSSLKKFDLESGKYAYWIQLTKNKTIKWDVVFSFKYYKIHLWSLKI